VWHWQAKSASAEVQIGADILFDPNRFDDERTAKFFGGFTVARRSHWPTSLASATLPVQRPV